MLVALYNETALNHLQIHNYAVGSLFGKIQLINLTNELLTLIIRNGSLVVKYNTHHLLGHFNTNEEGC